MEQETRRLEQRLEYLNLNANIKLNSKKLSTFNLIKLVNKQKIIEIVAKVLVAALTAFITAITTTSCMGRGPF